MHIRYQTGRIFEGRGKELKNDDISEEALERMCEGGVFDLQTWSLPEGIAECLLGCCAENGGSEDSVIYIAPAWNMLRDASFLLAARSGFEVACEIGDGKVKHLEIFSKLGKNAVSAIHSRKNEIYKLSAAEPAHLQHSRPTARRKALTRDAVNSSRCCFI